MTGEGFAGEGSPDRADALVWALTELMTKPKTPSVSFGVWGTFAGSQGNKSKLDGLITDGALRGGHAVSRY
jgi:hypothetical protein